MLNNKGFTILEILVAAAISLMIFLGFASLSNQMNKELKHSKQRADALEFRSEVVGLLSNLPICTCQMNQNLSPLDMTSSNVSGDLAELKSSCNATTSTLFAAPNQVIIGSNNRLMIDQMRLINIESLGAPDKFRGRLSFSYKKDNLLRLIPGFDIEIHFTTDPATPQSAKKVKSCDFVGGVNGNSGGTIAGTCPAGQFVNGISGGTVLCSAVAGNVSSPPQMPAVGQGCTGAACITADFGPCKGDSCLTNGYKCSGNSCTACGKNSTCDSPACCAGPQCPRCQNSFQ
ncbi:MAG: type IV pilus modification PilV family protein [Pseudobdellovibrionaceae bacterium]